MVATRRQKQAVADACNPLRDASILEHIFTFLPGHWLFLGAVCREWQALYASMEQQMLCCSEGHARFIFLQKCTSRTTLCSAAVASVATARLAQSCGLICTKEKKTLQVIAGKDADIETLAVLREAGMPLSTSLVQAVASSGRLDVLQHLITQWHCQLPTFLGFSAARSGSISMLNWLRAEGICTADAAMCAGAAAGGHLAALKHLRSEGCYWDGQDVAVFAAASGSIETIDWVRQQQGIEITADVMKAAAEAGETAMCEHLRSIGCAWNTSACNYAAVEGHLDTLRWLREHGCPWNVGELCMDAAGVGNIYVLEFVLERIVIEGDVIDPELLMESLNCAGASDQLEAAQWLRERVADWPPELTYATDENDEPELQEWSVPLIAWARAEGCTSPITL
jgi:hypothetical protein